MNWNKLPFCFLGSLLALGAATAGDWAQYRGPNQDGVAPAPAAYKEIARVKAVAGKCWSTPAFADGRVYIRSTKEGACLAAD
jgi:hypothetical protein